ncbi:hypothetical protein DM860_015590 [Cuscuta australis]|uniref:AB hydrolase-1 domain-containing protein n=1 Tax=Cuscuta australis TaxID=267555 RepID=A0A328EAG2_9ASTE|nr:hypothetical protein DM860_015590 [Cuscuta australis]
MQENYEAWVKGFAPLAVGADVPEAVQEFTRTLFNMRPDITLFVSQTVFNSDLRGVLGLVKCPCHIVQTAKDVSVPASVSTYLKNHLGGRNTVHLLPIEGHLPHLSAPALLAQVLKKALSPGLETGQARYRRRAILWMRTGLIKPSLGFVEIRFKSKIRVSKGLKISSATVIVSAAEYGLYCLVNSYLAAAVDSRCC